MRFLIADDSRVMRKIFRGALEAMQIPAQDIFEAADGPEAVRMLAETLPEVNFVIADWELPGMDGPAMHRHLRGSRKEIPVLFCIARDQRVISEEVKGAEFIERPFRDEVFQEVVRRLGADVRARHAQEGSGVPRSGVPAAEVELPFLIRLPTRLIEEFLKMSQRAKHPPGTEVVPAGTIVESLHVLTSGQVELIEPDGKVVQTCSDGDCFGELSFMLNQPSKVSVRAKTPIEVASLSRPLLGELVRRQPSLADYMSTLMTREWKKAGTMRITRSVNELMGSLESMPFSNVVRLLHVTQKSGALNLKEGSLSGGLYFQEGAVVHAWNGGMKGEAAFYHLAAWKKARFQFKSAPLQEPPTITQSTMMLLMEAMRRLDELESGANRSPVGSP